MRVMVMWRVLHLRAVYVYVCVRVRALYESCRAPFSLRIFFNLLNYRLLKTNQLLLKKVFFTLCKFCFDFPCLLFCLWLYFTFYIK